MGPTRVTDLLQRMLSTDLNTRPVEAAVTLLRVLTGLLIAGLHGWHKVVQGWAYLTDGSDWPLLHDTIRLGFPMPIASSIAAAMIQLFGGSLLATGLFTRPAAFLVATTLCTATVFNLQTGGPDAQLASLYALVTAAFAIIGGGRWSLDRRWMGSRGGSVRSR